MANIDSNLTITQTTGDSDSADLARLTATIGGSAQVLPQHVFDNENAGDTTSNNANGNFNNGGTNIQPGAVLTLDKGVQITGGSIQIRGHDVSNTPDNTEGGRLVLDGASLTCGRLGMQGFGPVAASPGASTNNPGPSALDFKNRPDSELPTLEFRNGAVLSVGGSSYQDYRAFLGNWSAGRLIGSDFTINFTGSNVSDGFGGFGTNHPVCFLGNRTNISNFTLYDPNRIEMNGPLSLSDATIEYATGTTGWFTQGGGRGAIAYIAGAPDTQATYGDITVIIDPSIDIFPNTGVNTFKLATLREAASKLTLQGEIDIQYDTERFDIQNHWCGWQGASGATIDYNRQYDFTQTIDYQATLQNADGTAAGPAVASKFAFIDQRDIFQVEQDGFDTRGRINQGTYTWYTMPNHAVAPNAGAQRNLVGYPTGLGVGSGVQRSVDDNNALRALNYSLTHDSDTEALTLDNNNSLSSVAPQHLRDLRRFNFRLGGSHYGYYPIFDNSVYGSFDYLGSGTVTVGEVKAIENAMGDLKRGYNIAHSYFQDEVVGTTPINTARGYNVTMTVTDTDDLNIPATAAVGASSVTLDQLYQYMHAWSFDNMLDSDDTWTVVSNLNSTNRDGESTSRRITTGALTDGQWRISNASGTIIGDTEAWPATGTVEASATNLAFTNCNGVVHGWREGYFFVQDSVVRANWALYRFELPYTTGSAVRTSTVTLIASGGNTGVFADSWDFQTFNLIDSSPNLNKTNRIRSYLWHDDVGLAPMEAAGAIAATKNLVIRQNASGSLTKGSLTGVNLNQYSSFDANSQPINIDIAAASQTATVINLPINSTAANPTVADGVNIGMATITVERGRKYIIAGDISSANFNVTGTGNDAQVLSVGNGVLPTTAVSGIEFAKLIEISFTAPSGTTLDTDQLDSELVFNMVALRGPNQNMLTGSNTPLATPPTGAIQAGDLLYDNTTGNPTHVMDSEWRTANVINQTQFTNPNATIPSAWNTWSVSVANAPLALGFGLGANTTLDTDEARVIVEWASNSQSSNYLVGYRDANNWAVYELGDPDVVTTSGGDNTLFVRIENTVSFQGNPGTQSDRINWWFGCDINGNDVDVFDETGFRLPNGTPLISNSQRTITYQYTIPTTEHIYYAFAARQNGANWYEVVSDNTEVTDTPNTNLVSIATSLVPINFSSSVNADHTTFIQNNDVFTSLATTVSSTNRMEIELSSTATRGGAADGRYLHRLVQQKTLFLQNVARGNYPLDGWTFVFDRITYSDLGVNVVWRKQTANANAVGFDVSTVNSVGSGVNNAITTTSTETYVLFNGATNIGIITPDQLRTLAKVSDVWAANAAL